MDYITIPRMNTYSPNSARFDVQLNAYSFVRDEISFEVMYCTIHQLIIEKYNCILSRETI